MHGMVGLYYANVSDNNVLDGTVEMGRFGGSNTTCVAAIFLNPNHLNPMKPIKEFSISEYHELIRLIKIRVNTVPKNEQKKIRDEMRAIGFFGGRDFGIKDMTVEKFEDLISRGLIMITGLELAKSSAPTTYMLEAELGKSSRTHTNRPTSNTDRDENYIINLCDEVLGLTASRQHTFDFLRGDTKDGKLGKTLPVDAYYPSLNLVIEYHEMQHTHDSPFFNRKATVSGVGRGEQRRIYDERRKLVLPQHGIQLIIFDFSEFEYGSGKRLKRTDNDIEVVRKRLEGVV